MVRAVLGSRVGGGRRTSSHCPSTYSGYASPVSRRSARPASTDHQEYRGSRAVPFAEANEHATNAAAQSVHVRVHARACVWMPMRAPMCKCACVRRPEKSGADGEKAAGRAERTFSVSPESPTEKRSTVLFDPYL